MQIVLWDKSKSKEISQKIQVKLTERGLSKALNSAKKQEGREFKG